MKGFRGFKKRIGVIVTIIAITALTVACEKTEKTEEVMLNKKEIKEGSLVLLNNDIENFKLEDGEYIKEKSSIIAYGGNTYISKVNDKYYIFFNGKTKEINIENYESLKISKEGKYITYLIYTDKGYVLNIIDLESSKEFTMETEVIMSGNYYDILNEKEIIYYGIDDNKNSGIYSYSLEEKKVKLLYKLHNGYIRFLKCIDGEIYFFKTYEEKNELKKIDKNLETNIITSKFKNISDIEKIGNEIFILGDNEERGKSLYSIKDENLDRIVYDFPSNINLEKGLSVSEKSVLFMSKTEGDESIVYGYNSEKSEIEALSREKLNYKFLEALS